MGCGGAAGEKEALGKMQQDVKTREKQRILMSMSEDTGSKAYKSENRQQEQ